MADSVVARLTDQSLLADLVLSEQLSGSSAREAALTRITEQRELARVAMNATSLALGSDAAERLSTENQALLLEVAEGSAVQAVGNVAVRKLSDAATITQLALDPDSPARLAATAMLTDQALLSRLALGMIARFAASPPLGSPTNFYSLESPLRMMIRMFVGAQ